MINEDLLSLSIKFFENRGYIVERNLKYEGFSGLLHSLDLLVKKDGEEHPVFVMDWNRTVGINIIIKVERVAEDSYLTHPFVIARTFSDHAKAYSNKKRIILITKRDILSKLETTP